MSVRVILVDDHPVVRDGLRFRIESAGAGMRVVGEAADGREAVDLARRLPADVYVMDVTMPVMNGIEATRELLRQDAGARVLILSLHDTDSIVHEALRAGARGYLNKETATRHVVEAIREVHAGRFYLGPEATRSVVQPLQSPGPGPDPASPGPAALLTRQERRVLQLIAEGHTSRQIAARLKVTMNTVHTHRNHLLAKVGVHNQAGLVRYAIREGIARP